jgi:hypothetical protein
VPQQALGKVDLATGHTTTWSRGSRYYTGDPGCLCAQDPCSSRSRHAPAAPA